MSSYSDLLKHPKWQKKRLEILERDGFSCQMCCDTESQLQVHHHEYVFGKKPWEYENESMICVCVECHEVLTESNKEIKEQLIRLKKLYPLDVYCDLMPTTLRMLEARFFIPPDILKMYKKYTGKEMVGG